MGIFGSLEGPITKEDDLIDVVRAFEVHQKYFANVSVDGAVFLKFIIFELRKRPLKLFFFLLFFNTSFLFKKKSRI